MFFVDKVELVDLSIQDFIEFPKWIELFLASVIFMNINCYSIFPKLKIFSFKF